jgi:hypothetical protein
VGLTFREHNKVARTYAMMLAINAQRAPSRGAINQQNILVIAAYHLMLRSFWVKTHGNWVEVGCQRVLREVVAQ